MRVDRRGFLKRAAALSLALAAGGGAAAGGYALTRGPDRDPTQASQGSLGLPGQARAASPADYATLDSRNPGNFTGPLKLPRPDGGLFGVLEVPAERFDLVARREALEILPGSRTDALVYRVEHEGRVYLNPTLKVEMGKSVAVRLANDIGENTIVHWHGLHVDWRNDGHPIYAVPSGQSYEYSFAVQNRAATYWYHPHPHLLTGRQVYRGLASFFLVEDEDERRLREQLDLQFGVTDLPLLIQDKRFDERGQLVYLSGDPTEQFSGFLGDVVAVNLSVNPSLDVSTRLYRFRLLNGSNARSYRLAFTRGNDSLPFQLIGTDGGLLAQAASVKELFLSPAERADVLLDLRDLGVGDTVFLRSLAFDPMHNEMGGMGHGGMQQSDGTMNGMSPSRLADGEAFYLLNLSVRERVAYDRSVSATLASVAPIDTRGAGSRVFELSAGMTMQWLINGRSFEMDRVLFSVRKGDTEVWEIRNADASMPHPMHLHGFQFQVMERRGSPSQLQGLAVDGKGMLPTDLGWKDTVLVWPGETVSVAASFAHSFEGEQTYLFHCHNLEREDMGMMVNYRVT